jgi:DNA-binding response OmpR family regulator
MRVCDNCVRLTRELREAQELIAEYERPGAVIDSRVYRVNNWLRRPCQIQSAKILVALLDAAGKVVPRDRLIHIIDYQGDLRIERILTVNVSRLNKALENKGMPRAVKNAFGEGYYIYDADADIIRAALNGS